MGFKPLARVLPASVAAQADTRGSFTAMDWDTVLRGGEYFTGVVIVEDCCGSLACKGRTLQHGAQVRIYLQEPVEWQLASKLTVLQFLVQEDAEGWILVQTGQGRLFVHGPFRAEALLSVKEACSGMGALGRGLCFLGYTVVAQNDIQEVTLREAARLSGAVPVKGDISSLSTVMALWDTKPGDCTLAAGVACQPYSRLGDQKSFQDERATTLPGTLRAGYLMQSSCVILECVPQVMNDSWVQQVIRDYALVRGHVLGQTVLSLHQVWVAKRDRWWCVIADKAVAPPTLVPWKPHGPWRSVSDVMDCFNVSSQEEIALTLSSYEKEVFASLKPLSSYCIQTGRPLPTALHSWGSPSVSAHAGVAMAPSGLNVCKRLESVPCWFLTWGRMMHKTSGSPRLRRPPCYVGSRRALSMVSRGLLWPWLGNSQVHCSPPGLGSKLPTGLTP